MDAGGSATQEQLPRGLGRGDLKNRILMCKHDILNQRPMNAALKVLTKASLPWALT